MLHWGITEESIEYLHIHVKQCKILLLFTEKTALHCSQSDRLVFYTLHPQTINIFN